MVDQKAPPVVYSTEIGGEAYKKDGKFYFSKAPDNGERKVGDEVPSGLSVWPFKGATTDGQVTH